LNSSNYNSRYKNRIKRWLETPEAETILSNVAKSLLIEALSRKLCFSFLGHEVIHNHEKTELLRDIQSELTLFILENKSNIHHTIVTTDRNLHILLKSAFINYWITKTRSPDKDPQRYLYKRAADLLRKSDTFHTISIKQRSTAFSVASKSTKIPPLALEDIRGIAFPQKIAETAEYRNINKKKILIDLANYFWNKVSEMWGGKPVWVDLRDFINWIGIYVQVNVPALIRESPGQTDPFGEKFIGGEGNLYQGLNPEETYFDLEQVKKWSKNFAHILKEKEKEIFYMQHRLNMSLEDIGKKMGYKAASGPKYILDNAEQKLKFFLRDLPWLSPDDFNKEAFSVFRESLLSELKKLTKKP
jgi:hypothetical protein